MMPMPFLVIMETYTCGDKACQNAYVISALHNQLYKGEVIFLFSRILEELESLAQGH